MPSLCQIRERAALTREEPQMTTLTPEQTVAAWDRHSHSQPAVPDDPRLPLVVPTLVHHRHRQLIAEGIPDYEVAVHSATAGEGTLDEIRNSSSGRVSRKGGGGWDVSAERDRLNLETVNLKVTDEIHGPSLTLHLTPGEARTIARQLLHMADRMELL